MRGIASLAVCWFHFTNAQFTESFSAYKATGAYGYLGVQIFFVISGFIIPWSLFRARYRIASIFRFLARRIVRLDPPYLCSVLVVLAGYLVSSMLPGHAHVYRIPWAQVLAHLGYVNAFLGMPWFQMTYWSLAVEFQYYLFVGLVFPLLAQKGLAGSLLMYVLFAAAGLGLGHNHELLPHHLPLFLMGITVFRFKCSISKRSELVLGMIFTAALAVVVEGSLEAMVGLASCGAILFVNASSRLLNFLGNISYSLYLMHVFVGQTVFGLAMKFPGSIGWMKWVVPWFALALAILVAYSLYRLVELPSKRWSAALRYGTPARQPSLSLETAERAA